MKSIVLALMIAINTITSVGAYAQANKEAPKASVKESATKSDAKSKPADAKKEATTSPTASTAAAAAAESLPIIKASDSFISTYDKYFAASDMLVEARALVKALESRQRDYEDSLRTEFPKTPGYIYDRIGHQFNPPAKVPEAISAAK